MKMRQKNPDIAAVGRRVVGQALAAELVERLIGAGFRLIVSTPGINNDTHVDTDAKTALSRMFGSNEEYLYVFSETHLYAIGRVTLIYDKAENAISDYWATSHPTRKRGRPNPEFIAACERLIAVIKALQAEATAREPQP